MTRATDPEAVLVPRLESIVFRRPMRAPVSRELRDASRSFLAILALVEEAMRSLAAAAPSGRRPGLPLAEALSGFERGLAGAAGGMASWRLAEVEEAWRACRAGLDEASARAERLRLGDAPDGYEQLYGTLADLMEPLEAFSVAVGRFRALGVR